MLLRKFRKVAKKMKIVQALEEAIRMWIDKGRGNIHKAPLTHRALVPLLWTNGLKIPLHIELLHKSSP